MIFVIWEEVNILQDDDDDYDIEGDEVPARGNTCGANGCIHDTCYVIRMKKITKKKAKEVD